MPERLLSKYKVVDLILSIAKAGQYLSQPGLEFKVQPGLHGETVSNNKIEHKKMMGSCFPPELLLSTLLKWYRFPDCGEKRMPRKALCKLP